MMFNSTAFRYLPLQLLSANDSYRKVNGDDTEVKKRGLLDKVRGVRDGLSDRIPQQHKDTANDHLSRGKQFLAEEYFPEERRDQFIYRGKKVITSAHHLSALLFRC